MRSKWPPLKPESEHFLHLDALRIIASVGVVAFHWRTWLDLDPAWRRIANGADGWFCFVDLFFVISGFIICHVYAPRMASAADYGGFLRKRVARLAPLHWLTLIYIAAIGIGAPLLGHPLNFADTYDLDCFIPNAALIHAFNVCDSLSFNTPSWSISAEMACYLLFPGFLALNRISVWLPGLASLALMALLSAIGPFGPEHRDWTHFTYDWGALRALPAFGVGVTLYGIRARLRIPYAGPLMYVALIILVALGQIGADFRLMLIDAYLIVVLGVAADAHAKHGAVTRWLAPFGMLTYSVYMLHVPVGATLLAALARGVLELPPLAMNLAVFAAAPVLLGVSYLSYALIETPARRWLSGPKAPRPDALAARDAT